jgi:hypothetical protein
MSTRFADELGKCYAKRGNLRIYKDREMFAVYLVGKEFLDFVDGKIVEGDRDEAVLVGYVSDISNKDLAFDVAQEEINSYSAS